MENYKTLHNKILKGARLAVEKLIKEAQVNDESLVFSKNGKIVKIKARKLKPKA